MFCEYSPRRGQPQISPGQSAAAALGSRSTNKRALKGNAVKHFEAGLSESLSFPGSAWERTAPEALPRHEQAEPAIHGVPRLEPGNENPSRRCLSGLRNEADRLPRAGCALHWEASSTDNAESFFVAKRECYISLERRDLSDEASRQ